MKQIFEKLVNKNAIKSQIGDPLQISPESPPSSRNFDKNWSYPSGFSTVCINVPTLSHLLLVLMKTYISFSFLAVLEYSD